MWGSRPSSDRTSASYLRVLMLSRRIAAGVPGLSGGVQLRYGKAAVSASFAGTSESFVECFSWPIASGRAMDADDVLYARKNCMITQGVLTELFGGRNPLGEQIKLDGERYTVVGVLTYREFTRPASEALDDVRWREEVRAGKAPPPPAFTSSFRKVIPTEESAESRRWQSLSDEPADQAGEASAGLGRSLGWALGGLVAMAACCVLTLVLAWQQRRRQTQGRNTKR